MTTIICDLDDTLCDARRRMTLWGDWDAFYADAINDPPIWPLVDLVRLFCDHHLFRVVIITAREEKYRGRTMNWLKDYEVEADELIMRPDGNHMTSPDLKMLLAVQRFGSELTREVSLVIDDRDDVLQRFRAIGIATLQATGGGYG